MKPGSIIFVARKYGNLGRAISQSGENSKSINHVGIIAENGYVIESSMPGVKKIDIDEFLVGSYFHRIYSIKDSSVVPYALERAKSFIGRPYNLTYMPNQIGLYCSELITESFKNKDGNNIFRLYRMRFDNVKFWEQYYKNFGMVVPFGVIGSHPYQLMIQKRLFEMNMEHTFC